MFWFLIVVVIVVALYSRSELKRQSPDGPRGIGILPDKNLKLYQQLANLVPSYGDFFSVRMGRSKVVVLSSPAAIDELFTKRGGKYASRPTASPQAKIVGQGRLIAMPYGDDFRVRGLFVIAVTYRAVRIDVDSPTETSQARAQPPWYAQRKNIPTISGVREPSDAQEFAGNPGLVLHGGSTLLDECHLQSPVSTLLMLVHLCNYLPWLQTWGPPTTRRCEDSRGYACGLSRYVQQ